MSAVYWTTKTGKRINVDEMDITHLRNTLKMLIRNSEQKLRQREVVLNGEIAQAMIQDEEDAEWAQELGYDEHLWP